MNIELQKVEYSSASFSDDETKGPVDINNYLNPISQDIYKKYSDNIVSLYLVLKF